LAAAVLVSASAQSRRVEASPRESEMTVHRCEGPPVFFTSDPRLIRGGRCEPLGNKPVVADQGSRLWRPTPPASAPAAGATAPKQPPVAAVVAPPPPLGSDPERRVSRAQQRERDTDRVAILRSEFSKEETRLKTLQERLSGAEQQPSKDPQRIAQLKDEIQRAKSDLQAIERELALATR
jgi:hypothetical protein